jgi:hypothetical protein
MSQARMVVTASALTSDAIGGSFKQGEIFTCDTKVAIELEKSGVARKAPDGAGGTASASDIAATPSSSK